MIEQNDWIAGEPALHDVFAEPIVHLVMRCDGVSSEDLRRAVLSAQGRLHRSHPQKAEAA